MSKTVCRAKYIAAWQCTESYPLTVIKYVLLSSVNSAQVFKHSCWPRSYNEQQDLHKSLGLQKIALILQVKHSLRLAVQSTINHIQQLQHMCYANFSDPLFTSQNSNCRLNHWSHCIFRFAMQMSLITYITNLSALLTHAQGILNHAKR